MNLNLKTLIGKLNDTTRLAATRAASICVALGQYEVCLLYTSPSPRDRG